MPATAARSTGSSASAAESSAIASSSAVYVLVAAIARSGPASQRDHLAGGGGQWRGGIVGDRDGRSALGTGRGDDTDDVRRGARLADPDDQRVGQIGRDAVERHDRWDPEPDRQPMPDAEDVLGVDRGMVRGPARGDDHVTRRAVAQRAGDLFDPVGLGGQESRGGGGLLEDLVVEAHRVCVRGGEWPAPVGGLGAGRLLAAETTPTVRARVALIGNSVRAMPRVGLLQRRDRLCPATWQSQPGQMLPTRANFVHPQDKVSRCASGGSAVPRGRTADPAGLSDHL